MVGVERSARILANREASFELRDERLDPGARVVGVREVVFVRVPTPSVFFKLSALRRGPSAHAREPA